MKRKIFYFLICLFVVSVSSCGKKQKADGSMSTSSTETTQEEQPSIDIAYLAGDYKGVLACEDCPGINTEVQINENRSYVIISKYLTKKGEELRDSGIINIVKDDIIELESQNMMRKTYFKATDSALYLTNPDGIVVTLKPDDPIDKYTLLKK